MRSRINMVGYQHNKNDMDMVTVIMNTVNEKIEYLDVAIQSYLNQKGIEIELIVSTVTGDPSINHIKKNYPACKIVTMPRSKHPICKGIKSPLGSFMQLNNALKHMTGDWFTFASSNDFAYENKCKLEVDACLNNKKLICYSAYDYVTENGEFKSTQLFYPYDRLKHQSGNFVSDCAIVHKSIVNALLPFKLEYNNYAYWDLWLRAYESLGDVFVYNPIPTWGYRQYSDSMHIKRQQDPEKLRQAQQDRDNMLKDHQP